MRIHTLFLPLFLIVGFFACQRSPEQITVLTVAPVVETRSASQVGDADDPAVWVHPTDPGLSVVIGTDKDKGLSVYTLAGEEIQHLPDGRMDNVDVRYNFLLGGRKVDLAVAGNRTNDTIAVYGLNPETRRLENVAARAIHTGLVMYGSCLYQSAKTGKVYAFVNSEQGAVEQWELFDNGEGKVDGRPMRTFRVGSQTEGCVADDELGFFYIGEEEEAIWKFGAEPDAGDERTLVDRAGTHIVPDVEGLTIYYGPNGTGYLIASSQGNDTFVVYRREGQNEYVMTFHVGAAEGIDEVNETDGIDVCSASLGPQFPGGLFVAHDGENENGDETNFKLVPWQSIAKLGASPLIINENWNPRF